MKTNLTNMWVGLTRAYEIALLGNFSIRVMFDSEYTEGFDDYHKIKEFFKGVEFASDGDIIVEITKPKDYSSGIGGETLNDILKRVGRVNNNEKPTRFTCVTCDKLLNTATDRLNLSYLDREKAIDIAKVIAQLDESKEIEPVHIAEAIQYVHFSIGIDNDRDVINAEGNQFMFGHGISISRGYLNKSDINKAINYLKSLL